MIAVDRFLTASAQQADVVLAASGPTEADGTTTNLEGRISTVARKITPPGTAHDDWMLAAELARLLGADLGVESAAQILEEIASVAPSHVGLTVDACTARRRRRGRSAATPEAGPRRRPEGMQLDPDAPSPAPTPASTRTPPRPPPRPTRRTPRRSSRPPRPRRPRRRPRAETPPDARPAAPAAAAGARASSAPPTADPPAVDAYSLRLVASRRLYDLGTDAQHSPGLAGLTRDTVLRLHPHDFDRLGVAAGTVVTATSSKGSVSLPVEPTDRVGRGAAVGHRRTSPAPPSARSSTPPRPSPRSGW